MDCKVIISPRAIQDLQEIVRYISFDNPEAAVRMGESLIDAAMGLTTFPEMGRLVREMGDEVSRELIVRPYRVIYRFDSITNAVLVSRFWHGARLLSPDDPLFRGSDS